MYKENINNSEENIIIDDEKYDKIKIRYSLAISFGFVIVLWAVAFLNWAFEMQFYKLGVYPREFKGLIGILTAPLIHADFSHLISNSFTLLILLFGVLYFYRTSAFSVFIIIYVVDGILVWLTARPSYHIGASGLIYGFASFLFFSGVFRKDRRSIALSLLVVFLYGSLVWGVLPIEKGVSFESHLFGAVTGAVCAFLYRKNDPPEKYSWEEEDEEEIEEGEDAGNEDEMDTEEDNIKSG
jgi:membrane associated rhomboid family serine protease